MRIDTHVHVTPEEISRNYKRYSEREAYFGLLSQTPHNRFATVEQVISNMEKTGIDKSIIFGFSFFDMALCQYVNDYVIEKTAQYKDKVIGFMSIVPNHPQAVYEIERCAGKGLRGIGELFPAGQPFQLGDIKDTGEMAACCSQYDLPVIIHLNEPIGHNYVGKTKTTLREAEQFILNHPQLKIILAHLGGGIWQYELMKEVRAAFKNVYYDNAAALFLYEPKVYALLKAAGLMDKCLFGSDYPLVSPDRYEKGLKESGLDEVSLRKLQGENAARLLGLESM